MRGNKRRGLVVVLGAALVVGVVTRLHRQPPTRAPAPKPAAVRTPTEFVHPMIPSPQVVKPAAAPCRARDLHGAARELVARHGEPTEREVAKAAVQVDHDNSYAKSQETALEWMIHKDIHVPGGTYLVQPDSPKRG